jgi:hypothetical protein
MDEALKINKLILILIAGILLTSLNSIPLVNAQPTPTSLTLAFLSPPTEKECTIAATLKDENGNPLQNMDIDFWVFGSWWANVETNETDSNGVASLKLSDNRPYGYYPRLNPSQTKITETWKIYAEFKGTTTTNYAPSRSEDVYIAFVLIDYTPYMIGGGLIAVAIIGVVGYIVFRRRKKATPRKPMKPKLWFHPRIPKMTKEA